MVIKYRRRKMYERPTNYPASKKEDKKIYSQAEVRNSQGVGTNRKRYPGSRKTSDSSSHSIPLEKGVRARGRDYPQGKKTQAGSPNKKVREREPIPQRGPCLSESGTNAFKKRNERGLSNRKKGQHFSKEQRERIIEEILRVGNQGISKTWAFSQLGICRSTYYGWLKPKETKARNNPPNRLLPDEREAVVDLKNKEPYLSHRKISGFLRKDSFFISSSSCYQILKSLGWIKPQNLRESPRKKLRYEPFRPNHIWGEDWTQLIVNGLRYDLTDYHRLLFPLYHSLGNCKNRDQERSTGSPCSCLYKRRD
jgi:transposase-like protein